MRCTHDGLIRVVFAFVLPAGLLLASGCATFNLDWTMTANRPTPTNSLLGQWEGTWLSEANGHNGNLRCVVTQKKDGTSGPGSMRSTRRCLVLVTRCN